MKYYSISTNLVGVEVIYCNRDNWGTQYSDTFERSENDGDWGDKQICPEGYYIYGFWWTTSYNYILNSFQGLGFWCDNFWTTENYVLYHSGWFFRYHLPRKQ
jgi:hypothetical protein